MPHRDLIAAVRAAGIDRQRAHDRFKAAMREAIEGGVSPGELAELSLGDGLAVNTARRVGGRAFALELEAVLRRRSRRAPARQR